MAKKTKEKIEKRFEEFNRFDFSSYAMNVAKSIGTSIALTVFVDPHRELILFNDARSIRIEPEEESSKASQEVEQQLQAVLNNKSMSMEEPDTNYFG